MNAHSLKLNGLCCPAVQPNYESSSLKNRNAVKPLPKKRLKQFGNRFEKKKFEPISNQSERASEKVGQTSFVLLDKHGNL